jgi:hypothetical protein
MAHIRLHVKQADGGLPMVCMRCGEPATVVKTKKMSYYPRGLLLLVLAGAPGLIILVVLALVLRKRARLQAPLCDQHQSHWPIRLAISWAAAIAAILFGVATVVLLILLENAGPRQGDVFSPFLCFGGLVVFIGLLILLAVVQNTAIRPDEITATHILLNGVADAFVTAVEEAEIERRVRLRQWEYEDEAERPLRRHAGDDEESRPRRPPSSDAFEEDRPRPAPPNDAFE